MTTHQVTLLLRDVPASDRAGLLAWGQRLSFAARGIELTVGEAPEPELSFSLPGEQGEQRIVGLLGRAPVPRAALDLGLVPSDFQLGRGSLRLSDPASGSLERQRAAGPLTTDPWGPKGSLRNLSRLVLALLPDCVGVVLPAANGLVKDPERFAAQLGELESDSRAYTAWTDTAIVQQEATRTTELSVQGLSAFGLPSVAVPAEMKDRWSLARSEEAARYAAGLMVRDNRALAEGEVLAVPIGFGALIPESPPPGMDQQAYRVVLREGAVTLLPLETVDPKASWAAACRGEQAIALNTYMALFECQLSEVWDGVVTLDVVGPDPDAPRHALRARKLRSLPGALTYTAGFGRLIQNGNQPVKHVELVAWSERSAQVVSALVDETAGLFLSQQQPRPPWIAHVLQRDLPEFGLGGFVFGDGGLVQMGEGSPIQLLLLIPATAAEYPEIRKGVGSWLADHAAPNARTAELRERWTLASRG